MSLGTYDDNTITFVRHLNHPIDKVWAAVSTPEGLQHWFPSEVTFDVDTMTVSFTGDPNLASTTGKLLEHQPYRLAFEWGGDELHLDLEETATGTTLTLRNVLQASNTAARNATGWYVCLDELAKSLDGTPTKGPHSEDALPFQPLYDTHVDAGLPHGAPIPGAGGA